MILAGEVLPEQLGAFLMLLRIKEETGEEIAGFVRAARASLPTPVAAGVDLDWPSYAGKKRQLPWFLLGALLLAQAGWRVVMHGLDGVTEGRLYSGESLARLGVPLARDICRCRRPSRAAKLRLSLARAHQPRTRANVGAEAHSRAALADQHGRSRPQSIRRENLAAGRLSSGLCRRPSRRRLGVARRADADLSRRRRRERAAAEQASRDPERRRRRRRGNALAADDRSAPGDRRSDGRRAARRGLARRQRFLRRGGGGRRGRDRALCDGDRARPGKRRGRARRLWSERNRARLLAA